MKNKFVKPLSIFLCGALIFGSAGAVYALNGNKENETKTENAPVINEEEPSSLQKDETVYVLSNADGSVEKIIVSDWIKNVLGNDSVTDKSELTNIENVNGEESYTTNADNIRVWDAMGNDIYYQGDIKKELPVDLSVSYTLDGKSISPDELVGKSGKVTIRFDYKNNQYEMVFIDGSKEKIYVPFVMMTGLILNNDVFSNVEVSNGKILNDGDRILIAGIAFPGLSDNLNIDREKLDFPDYVEITADVDGFYMTNTITIATNEIFNELDTKKLDSMDDINGSLNEIVTAMDQLMDGSSALYSGLSTLLEKSNYLSSGIINLADGALTLKNGALTLKNGTSTLNDGAKDLSDGLNTLSSNNDTLNDGAKEIFETLLATADNELAAAGLSIPKLTIENYGETLDATIEALEKDNANEWAVAKINALKKQLDGYNQFYKGLSEYTAGVLKAKNGADKLYAGAKQLKTGSSNLYDGTDNLYNGILTIQSAMPGLCDGVKDLCDGAMQLSDGLKTFNEEGVQKLIYAVDGDIGGVLKRFKATCSVSKNYKSFSGISDEMDGQVKFIYRTEAAEAE